MEQYPPQQTAEVPFAVPDTSAVSPVQQPTPIPTIPTVNEPSDNTSKKMDIKTIIMMLVIVVLIIALIVGGYLVISGNKKPSPTPSPVAQTLTTPPAASPSATPITGSNADAALNQTDTNISNSLDQMNSDLNTYNSINAQQDNPNTL